MRRASFGRARRALLAVVAGGLAVAQVTLAAPSGAYERPGSTTRLSVTRGALQLNGDSIEPAISANGRYVVFFSGATNLVRHESGAGYNVFRLDLRTEKVEQVSVGLDGLPPTGTCLANNATGFTYAEGWPSISASGRYVSFSSCATNLVSGDTNLSLDVFVRDMNTGRTTRVDVTKNGSQTFRGTVSTSESSQSISGTGRLVTFSSNSPNLLPGWNGSDNQPDGQDEGAPVFVHDRVTGRNTLETVSSAGKPGTTSSITECGNSEGTESISSSGRWVAFVSSQDGLVAGVDDGTRNEYVHDNKTGTTELINQAASGGKSSSSAPTDCQVTKPPMISRDGRFVAYESYDPGLVPNDGPYQDFNDYVYDRSTHRTRKVDVTSAGEFNDGLPPPAGNCPGGACGPDLVRPSISANDRYVVLEERFPRQPKGQVMEAYVYDLETGAAQVASVSSNGVYANGEVGSSFTVDGRHVVFDSVANDLVPRDTNSGLGLLTQGSDIFMHDMGPELGVGGFGGSPGGGGSGGGGGICVDVVCIPPSTALSETDPATDVSGGLAAQGADLIGASVSNRPRSRDLFVREELQRMPSVSGTPAVGNPGILYGFDLTADRARYEVRVQRIPGPSYDPEGGASFGLFRRDANGLWSQVATLRGGYGTTGEEVVFSVPLRDLGLRHGGRLRQVRAFTAIGSYELGPASVLDTLALQGSGRNAR